MRDSSEAAVTPGIQVNFKASEAFAEEWLDD